ncbi:MAG: hypothetical protein A2W91_20245 [Bacteroidetes bacterium GWF2_38_335]|nr:MAG: hypothetical protein A2W91_20245 [Bacteroidetes bacterium GWF2_38_335]OFY79508.1 MAG: hypothetical protein A2281_13840 [Bacteroidetes bacterium RIFOXYA12_FULL_38_20]HBS86553.1 EamA family transporter [Bacteroidales bacterium]
MDLNNKPVQWAIIIMVAFTWGTSFILMKFGLRDYDMYQVGALRIFISFIVLLPLAIYHIRKLNKKNFPVLFFIGLIGNTLPAFLFTKAQTHISSSMAGILNSLTPMFALLIGVYFFKDKVSKINVIGIIIAFIGACGLMIKSDIQGFFGSANWYALFVVVAALLYGANLNLIKHKLKNLNPFATISLAFMLSGPPCGVTLLFTDFTPAINSPTGLESLMFIAMLAVFSSVLALSVYYVIIPYITTIFASSVTYIIPIFAIMWGVIFGESLMFTDFLWGMIILIGIYLVNLKNSKAKI